MERGHSKVGRCSPISGGMEEEQTKGEIRMTFFEWALGIAVSGVLGATGLYLSSYKMDV